MSKRLSEYFASFDQFDKPLFVLPTTSGSISIALFATVTGIPVGITSASFSLDFHCLQDLQKIDENNKK